MVDGLDYNAFLRLFLAGVLLKTSLKASEDKMKVLGSFCDPRLWVRPKLSCLLCFVRNIPLDVVFGENVFLG